VPDGILQTFPFATLVDAQGAFLLEAHALAVSPSASVFLQTPRHASGSMLLAVAQPAPAGFTPLPAAAAEVREIAAAHPRSTVARGQSVSPEEFLEWAARAEVVHFAGHATTDELHPSRSCLMFESPDGGAAELTAETIGKSSLDSHPLIVLAACSTGRGRLRRSEGIDSLAAAFLRSGASGVVATLWDIDDDASTKLFRTLHANLRAGARPADALRAAQRSMLHSGDAREHDPRVWGSVTLIGAL
jgi:CHAT domain-containing protein